MKLLVSYLPHKLFDKTLFVNITHVNIPEDVYPYYPIIHYKDNRYMTAIDYFTMMFKEIDAFLEIQEVIDNNTEIKVVFLENTCISLRVIDKLYKEVEANVFIMTHNNKLTFDFIDVIYEQVS